MPTYCAFLGHQPHVSLAELAVLLPDITVKKLWSPYIITFEAAAELDSDWLATVGGIVLIAKELRHLEPASRSQKHHLHEVIPSLLLKELAGVKRKATFSFRCFSIPRSDIRTLYRSCKQYLRAKGTPSRYIGNERNPAKPGTLLLRGIPGPGTAELVILLDERKGDLWIGATCAVQDIQAYTDRDMGKPFRDTKTGLLPPKLAQVLLNLALLSLPADLRKALLAKNASWERVTVWDPFCGSGVILLEALLRRAHVLGSDRSERAVKGTEQNVQWLREKLKTPRAITSAVWKHNALKPPELPARPTVIVTETSLGPPLHAPLAKRELASILRETEEREIQFFRMLAVNFPELPVVCTFPVYVARDGSHHFLPRIGNVLQELGYRFTFPALKHIRFTDRHSLLYIRPDQFVGREIFCLLAPRSSKSVVGLPPMKKQEAIIAPEVRKEVPKASLKKKMQRPRKRDYAHGKKWKGKRGR